MFKSEYTPCRSRKGFPGQALLFALAALVAGALVPVAAGAAAGIQLTHIAVGSTHSCGLTTGGGVMCWGEASHGQLGNGQGDMFTPPSPVPVAVAGLARGVVDLALGGVGHSCALMADGQVKCWGWNGNGQLGIGRIDAGTSTPLTVVGLGVPVTKITAGEYHTCALTAGGQMACWGNNVSGQLGSGTIEMTSSTPVIVPGLGGSIIDIAAGSSHTCALMTGGGVKCWGDNSIGQLGNGATGTGGSAPVNVAGLTSGVAALSAGGTHTCALTTGGGVKCWGNNYGGQLGNGTAGGLSSVPVDVNGLSSGVVSVKAGSGSTCAVISTGGIKCWGGNDRGQIGDGTKTNRANPVDVIGLPPHRPQLALPPMAPRPLLIPAEISRPVRPPPSRWPSASPTPAPSLPGAAKPPTSAGREQPRPARQRYGRRRPGRPGAGQEDLPQPAPAVACGGPGAYLRPDLGGGRQMLGEQRHGTIR